MNFLRLPAWARAIARVAEDDSRWIVVDTETSGLDPVRDRLLAIGAVAVNGDGIRLGDSFEAILRADAVGNRDNVAIHGIGHDAQKRGMPVQEALRAFDAFATSAPCIGFHCEFDRVVLAQCARTAGVAMARRRWLDLAALAAALLPESHRRGERSLDDWLSRFDIGVVARHNAAGDALATAELLLRLRALAAKQRVHGFSGLLRLSRQRHWLGG